MTTHPKKLIEVALPLPEINDASAYDKMPGIGPHPKGIHHWWARLPLPTARAVLFASVVDDPSSHPEKFPTEEAQNAERERLFDIVRELMQKKLHERPDVYAKAREEMLKHTGGKLPPVLDPFAGGGSIPLEAARLGFEAHAADLNPVAVLLNKCNLELVPRWLDRPPVNPEVRRNVLRNTGWTGARGLAEDVRYYGNLIRERAIQKIGHLYPKVKLPKEYGGREANVIAWLWARTVASPNPAAQGAHVPLVRSFWLSTKDKSGRAYVEPVINKDTLEYGFRVKIGKPSGNFNPAKGTVNRNGGTCLLTDAPIPFDHIRSEGKAGRIGFRLLAIVAELSRGRTYVSPVPDHEGVAEIACVDGYPDSDVPEKALGFRVQLYGMNKHYKMFTPRQLTTMVTLSDLVKEVRRDVFRDACEAGLSDSEADHYALAVVTFLALALDRCADFNNGLCRWTAGNQKVMNLFGRQAIPMVWDFAEANTLGDSVGAWATCSNYVADCIEVLGKSSGSCGNGL